MNKPVILEVPFYPDEDRYRHRIRYESIDDAQVEASELFDISTRTLKPKILLRQMFITEHAMEDGLPVITIEGETFRGKALGELNEVHRVIGYVVTCGDEMEEHDLSSSDFLAPFWLDTIKSMAYGAARRFLFDYCREHFGFTKPSSINPGSGNVDIWPIEQLQGLFRLLGGTEGIGVQLTESSLMIPNKSLSGLMFTTAEGDYESCAFCERDTCPTRRVPFREHL